MYKLTYEQLGKPLQVKTFKELPKIREVEEATGNLLSFGLYDTLCTKGSVYGMNGAYSLCKIPTIEQLDEAWKDFLSVAIYQDLRFGQHFYNEYNFEINNSYNIERPYLAYQVLYEALVTTLDDLLGEE